MALSYASGMMSGELTTVDNNMHRSVTDNDHNMQGVDGRMSFTPCSPTSPEAGALEADTFDMAARTNSTKQISRMRGSLKSINNRAGFRHKLR